MASATSTPLRLVLRAGLLGGALLDSALAIATLAASMGYVLSAPLFASAASYSWLLWPALAGRAGIQAFACYDRRRYDSAIPWLALTLVSTGLAAWREDALPPSLVAAYGLIGTVQLISWWRTR